MNVLLKMAKHEEDNAARGLKAAQAQLITAQRTYQQISQYALTYHQQLIDSSTKEAQSGLTWQQYTQFLASLDHSKRTQVFKIAEDNKLVQQRRKVWLSYHQNRRKIEFLLNKQKDIIEKRLDKFEATELNELINQYHTRSK